MGWVRDFVSFPPRTKCLLLPRNRALQDALKLFEDKPEVLEAALLVIIKQHRPDLAECSIQGMAMNYEQCCWEVRVEHQSFPAVPFGDAMKRERLINEGEA